MSALSLINVCPHVVSYLDEDGTMRTLPPEATPARVEMTPGKAQVFAVNPDREHGVRFVAPSTIGRVTGLPDPKPGVVYVASMLVAQQAAREGRADVVSPDSGPTAIREAGQVVAVRGFCRWSDLPFGAQ